MITSSRSSSTTRPRRMPSQPLMMEQLSDALTELHDTEELWVGVICAEGRDFHGRPGTCRSFFGPTAENRNFKEGKCRRVRPEQALQKSRL